MIVLLLACLLTTACEGGAAEPTYVPRDAALRALPLYFYPVADGRRALAFVFLFGNDVGFWKPHRELAAATARQGYDVVGFDLKPLFATLPTDPAARQRTFGDTVALIIAAARHELQADSLPLVVGGHSLGAEVAAWTGAHVTLPYLSGVLALSPGSRSHLRVSLSDLASGPEPTGAGSFAVSSEVAALPAGVRFAIVRGSHDRYAFADSALVAAGGNRAERYVVPFAGHSLRRITFARRAVRQALDWLIGTRATGVASR
jgi:pimeloyl-ACP methyl ester carboxylesterase